MLLFAVGGFVTVFANSFNTLLLGRLIQGFGTAGCFTLSIAILFDLLKEDLAMRVLNSLDFTLMIFMTLAPVLGSLLYTKFGFQSNFIFITVLGFCGLVASAIFLQESHPKEKQISFNLRSISSNIWFVVSSFDFWQMALIVGFLFSGYIAFLSGTSMLFVSEYHLNPNLLPFFQALALLGWLVGNISFGFFQKKWGLMKLKRAAMFFLVFGILVFSIDVFFLPNRCLLLSATMSLFSFAASWIVCIYQSIGMKIFADFTGIVSSFLTSWKLFLSFVILMVVEKSYDHTIFPIYILIVLVVIGTVSTALRYDAFVVKRSYSEANEDSI